MPSTARPKSRKRGRPARLDREKIVAAALDMIDRQGIDALSMRKLAASLGVEAMSLYNHVRNKSDLLDAAAARAMLDLPRPDPASPWRERVESLVLGLYDVLLAHPFLVLYLGREGTAPSDPGVLAIMDAAVSALADAGLNPAAQVSAFRGLIAMCKGFVLAHTMGLSVTKAEAESIWAEWDSGKWNEKGLPHLARLGPQFLATRPDDDLRFMLDTFLSPLDGMSRALGTDD